MKAVVWGSSKEIYAELYSAAKILSSDVIATVISPKEGDLEAIKNIGFSKIYWFKNENLAVYEVNRYAKILGSVFERENADFIIIDSKIKGKILAGALSGKLSLRAIVDVFDIEKAAGNVVFKRIVYGGQAYAIIGLDSDKAIIAIKPGSFKPSSDKGEAELIVEESSVDSPVELVDFKAKTLEGLANLTEAKIVVGAGRGIKKREDLEMIKQLAEMLGGAWGVTRPLAADYGWTPIWIGVSGVSIKPDLYIAVGISGQPQHISGIRESKIIVAINIDENAPIFEHADYGVIGDLYQVLPRLIEKLKNIKK